MSSTNLFIDVHILQDIPPSNINRDDNGSPKQAIYGGANRLRVSSQAWKRATRLAFGADLEPQATGVRTRRLQHLLEHEVVNRGISEADAGRLTASALRSLKITPGKKKAEDLSYLLFFSRGQLAQIAEALTALTPELPALDEKALDAAVEQIGVKGILGQGHSLDVALFGRMVADLADLNVDAAAQVAHAISTHAVQAQFDYFTAVDDEQADGETGAGMIGTIEFNAATLYRFATVALPQLEHNLADHDQAVDGIRRFIKAFALSMPTGHQTSFAPRTRPALIAVVVRGDQPVNLVSAFEKPVRGGLEGTVAASQTALARTYLAEIERWGDAPVLVVASYRADGMAESALRDAFGPAHSLDELLDAVTGAVSGAGNGDD